MDYAEGVLILAESVVFPILIYESYHFKSTHLWKQNKNPEKKKHWKGSWLTYYLLLLDFIRNCLSDHQKYALNLF